MELRHLRSLVTRAREGNFTRAARRLRIAQPALSQQIRSLERELGVLLVARTNRTSGLTEAGARLIRLYEVWGKTERAALWRAQLSLPTRKADPSA